MIETIDPEQRRRTAQTPSGRSGAETRRRLIASAEELFGDRGIDGVSVRSVNAHAGVGPAAVHYHFGSKAGLVEAVIGARAADVLEAVSAGTAALAARPDAPTARELIEVLASPYLSLIRRDPERGLSWVKLVATLEMADDARIRLVFDEVDGPLHAEVLRAFPEVPAETLRLRWGLARRALIQMLGQIGPRLAPARPDPNQDRYDEELIAFVSGGLEAIRSQGFVASDREVILRLIGGEADPSPARLRAASSG
jgi:AcrR family transcriptional regulator